MKIGIMQPYLFPYIGYFQLVHAVDKFVILDNVNFINRGWINRNRILVNGKDFLFSIPVKDASQNKLILDCSFGDDPWQKKFLRTIEMNYKKAPFFEPVYALIDKIVHYDDKQISRFVVHQLTSIFNYLDLNPTIEPTSSVYETSDVKGEEKIMAICKQEKASHYINPIGGSELYDRSRFEHENIQLSFLKTREIVYEQGANPFVPYLSIIDILMYNSKERVQNYLNEYDLI